MKRIITIKEYIISSIIIVCLFVIVLKDKFTIHGPNLILNEVSIYEANINLYKITIISYIFVIIEAVTINKRNRRKKLRKSYSYKLVSISLLSTIFMSIHIAFWFSISRDVYIGILLLLSSVLFLRILLRNRACLNDDYFSVNNKLYSINGLKSIEDDYSSTLGKNFIVEINSTKYKICCGSVREKEELMNGLKKYL